jgi:hypothetical protein
MRNGTRALATGAITTALLSAGIAVPVLAAMGSSAATLSGVQTAGPGPSMSASPIPGPGNGPGFRCAQQNPLRVHSMGVTPLKWTYVSRKISAEYRISRCSVVIGNRNSSLILTPGLRVVARS